MPVLVLDIDGTMLPLDKKTSEQLPSEINYGALKQMDNLTRHIPRYINTARSQRYCEDPDPLTLYFVRPENHRCLVGDDVVESKVRNMIEIAKAENVEESKRACTLLIDDRPENIKAIKREGFSGILVDASEGITEETVREVQRTFARCEFG